MGGTSTYVSVVMYVFFFFGGGGGGKGTVVSNEFPHRPWYKAQARC